MAKAKAAARKSVKRVPSRRARPQQAAMPRSMQNRGSGDTSVLDQLQSVAAREDLAARVEAEFDKELLELAMLRARERVAESTWEAFRLAALEQMAPQAVADKLGVRVSQVYLAKHRVQKLVQEEIRAIEGTPPEE